jgi:hypothetical protein
MRSMDFSIKLMEITKAIAGITDGISYILNEKDIYTIGTRNYDVKIAQYLDQTVKSWHVSEANLASLKKKRRDDNPIDNDAYLWKIPISESNLQLTD